jgi:predicted Zn-dependent protease
MLFVGQLGYNPHAMVELMQRLQKNQGNLKFGKVAQPFNERLSGLRDFLKQQGIADKTTADTKILDQRFAAAWGKTGVN